MRKLNCGKMVNKKKCRSCKPSRSKHTRGRIILCRITTPKLK